MKTLADTHIRILEQGIRVIFTLMHDSRQYGSITLIRPGGDEPYEIEESEVHSLFRGKGYGLDLYLAAVKYASEEGSGLYSDDEWSSGSAKAVRARLRARGAIITEHDEGVLMVGKIPPSIPVQDESGTRSASIRRVVGNHS